MPVIPGLIFTPATGFSFFFFWIIPCQVPAPRLYMSTHARESKAVMDSGFHAMDSGFRLLDSRSCSGLEFQIPVVSKMPDSYSCIPDWKAQDSGFHKQKITKIPDTTCKNSPDSFTCGEYTRPASLACAFRYHQLCYILNTGLSIII